MISTRGRYALRVLLDLAEQQSPDYIPLKEIAQRQEISEKYLQIIVKELVRANFLIGASGKGGGYKLTRSPDAYNIGEILELMEGSLASVACLQSGAAPCMRSSRCKTLNMWKRFDAMAHDFFYSLTLADLLAEEVDSPWSSQL